MNSSLVTSSHAHRYSSKLREGLMNIECSNTSFYCVVSVFLTGESTKDGF